MIPDIIALRRIAGVLILAALCIAGSPDAAAARDPAPDQPRVPAPVAAARHEATPSLAWVNPYIGTGSGGGGGSDYGGTMPFVTTPFGMTNWTAQTRENRISVSSYAFEDDTIAGFIGTHQPAIWMGDYGYVTLAPEIAGYNPDRMDAHLTNVALPNFKGYFVVRFNRSLATHGVYLREAAEPGGTTATGPNVGAYASFDTAAGRVVEAKVGTSFISLG